MCGIVGYNGFRNAADVLFDGLKRLEYRGYDSVGIAVNGRMEKCVGSVDSIKGKLKKFKGSIGIAHTRWATNGGISVRNAHPQTDCKKNIFVVHNGIIENYEILKDELIKKGHKFISDTDTEVIPHFIEEELKKGNTILNAMKKFINVAKGTYAAIIMRLNDDNLYVMKKSSPLALGIRKNEMIIGSDIFAFSNLTNRAIFFDDGEYAVIGKDKYQIYKNGKKVVKKPITFKWKYEHENKKYKHFMLKEIHEEPEAVERLLKSLRIEQKETFEKFVKEIKKAKKIYFIAAGTSYHASLIGAYLLNKIGIDARSIIASEFENYSNVDEKTLLIAISQSGETMDVINAMKKFPKNKILSIVNVPYSTIQRISNCSIEIMAGQEIAVAATKSFINQVVLLMEIAKRFGLKFSGSTSKSIRNFIESNENKIKRLAKKLRNKNSVYIIGRGINYPIAREIALKLKEISYIHAEGMMGGELKHGTIALIQKNTPVISLISGERSISDMNEIKSHGAYIIPIVDSHKNAKLDIKPFIKIKNNFPIEAAIFGHLLSYYIALYNNLPIDKPRNLAKSVTVM